MFSDFWNPNQIASCKHLQCLCCNDSYNGRNTKGNAVITLVSFWMTTFLRILIQKKNYSRHVFFTWICMYMVNFCVKGLTILKSVVNIVKIYLIYWQHLWFNDGCGAITAIENFHVKNQNDFFVFVFFKWTGYCQTAVIPHHSPVYPGVHTGSAGPRRLDIRQRTEDGNC